MLGAGIGVGRSGVQPECMEELLGRRLPEKLLPVNRKALRAGCRLCTQGRKGEKE